MSTSDAIEATVEASDTVPTPEEPVLGSVASHGTLDGSSNIGSSAVSKDAVTETDQPRESTLEEPSTAEPRIERDPDEGEAEAEMDFAERGLDGQPRPLTVVLPETTAEGESGALTGERRWEGLELSLVPTPGVHPDWLPANWLVEERLRANGKTRDKYYYEPQSTRKFRSRREVEDYLNNVSPKSKTARTGAKSAPSSSSKKKSSSRDDDCPTKVKWVLNDDSGFSWNPMICDQEVPEHKRQSWESAFEFACHGNRR
ncbi:Methyl-CpG-binding domain-containing protein 5 [Acorus calamus]|uniref:Methyl-CpG-binding domain-containing protein 5 n=1 Tax=Acorus calamus TaxID=4465 RepID=A0AAV9DDZ8_ACOCL|nr:Methyl-CpG-binding domain-containing protein 5 [Acorus calamus]